MTFATGAQISVSDFTITGATLARVLGRTVIDASHNGHGGLRLQFDDCALLEILDDTEQFEAFQLHLAGHIHVA